MVEAKQESINDEKKEEYNEVKVWLTNDLKLGQYVPLFMEDGWDDMKTIIKTVTEDDLLDIGIKKKGHRRKIMLSITELKKCNNTGDNEVAAIGVNPGQEDIVYNNDHVEGISVVDTARVDNIGIAGANVDDTAK